MDIERENISEKRIRIGIFLPNLGGGGAERVMLNLAMELTERGYKVDFLLRNAAGKYISNVPPTVKILDFQASRMIAALPHLIHYINSHRPDILLSALDVPNILTVLANILSKYKTKTALSFHYHGFASKFIEKKFARVLYPKADIIIAVSQDVAKFVSTDLHIDLDRIKVIYNPVITPDLERLANEEINHYFDKLPVILGVGRLVAQKDFELLIRAFSRVRQEMPARLLILGEGVCRDRLWNLAKELGLGNDLSMPGFVNNPYAYMKRSSVFVLSSTSEGFGNVVAEALACGCPVVSTDCPSGPREILKDGEYGILVPIGDVDAMALAILDMLKHKRKPVDANWLKQFSVNTVVDSYLCAFDLPHKTT